MGSAGITPAKVLRKYHVIPATKSLNTPALLFRHDPIKNPRRAPRHNRPAKRGGTQPFRPEGGRDTTRLFGRAQKKQTQITETARALSPRREHGKPRKGARLPWYKKKVPRFTEPITSLLPRTSSGRSYRSLPELRVPRTIRNTNRFQVRRS